MTKTFSEHAAVWLFNVIDGFRITNAQIFYFLLCASSMGINYAYGWKLGDQNIQFHGFSISCILFGVMLLSLDGALFYLGRMTPIIAREYGKGWYITYILVALLLAQTMFTAAALFSSTKESKIQAKDDQVTSSIVDLASKSGNSAVKAQDNWTAKLGNTHNNTTSWNDMREIEAARADKALDTLIDIRNDKKNEINAEDAIFEKYELGWLEKNVRSIFAALFALSALWVSIFLKLDAEMTSKKYIKIKEPEDKTGEETDDNSLTANKKPGNRKKTASVTLGKNDAKYQKAVELTQSHGFGDSPSISTVHNHLKPISKERVGNIMKALADENLIEKVGQRYIYKVEKKRGLFSVK